MLTVAWNYEALEFADLRNHLQIDKLEKMYLSLLSQKAGKVVWYFCLFKNFPVCCDPQCQSFDVAEAEVGLFLEFSFFFYNPTNIGIRSLVPLPFLNPACTHGSSQFRYCWSLALRILSITLLACEMSSIVW